MKISIFSIIFLIVFSFTCIAQVEDVAVSHPVYSFLSHIEARGLIPHISLSSLPLQRKQIVDILVELRKKSKNLNPSELQILTGFETEFEIIARNNAVVIFSGSDSTRSTFLEILQ